jgi:hypothetical protein
VPAELISVDDRFAAQTMPLASVKFSSSVPECCMSELRLHNATRVFDSSLRRCARMRRNGFVHDDRVIEPFTLERFDRRYAGFM